MVAESQKIKEPWTRSLVKTITYRIFIIILDFTFIYLLTRARADRQPLEGGPRRGEGEGTEIDIGVCEPVLHSPSTRTFPRSSLPVVHRSNVSCCRE